MLSATFLAALIEREADNYEANSAGMTDVDGERYDRGWLAGMRHAAEILRAHRDGGDGDG